MIIMGEMKPLQIKDQDFAEIWTTQRQIWIQKAQGPQQE